MKRLREWARQLGPGLITGAADDDPSGIATYSQAGAQFGFLTLWTIVFTYPLMVGIQLVSARIGRVTGHGLASNIGRNFPRPVLYGVVALLVVANTVNIAADIAAMGESLQLVIGGPPHAYAVVFGVLCLLLQVFLSYRRYVRYLKWLTLALLAYVLVLLTIHIPWSVVAAHTLTPHFALTADYLTVVVAVFGTTISPYLFFWQAAQEVETERAMGRDLAHRQGATRAELAACRTDVVTGMFASNAIMYFIIVTTAATLHAHGKTSIATAQEAAEALRPLAGAGAYWLFTLGLIGTGILAVPVLAGSCAYAIAEASAWRGSLDRPPARAKKFYGVLAVAMTLGIALNYAGLNAIKLLFTTAVINGVLAPPLILIVLLLTSDQSVMGANVNSRPLACLGWLTLAVMIVAALGLFLAS
jgi:NRAMP (natural resistance-associated macrophage protein)-like metal ion transporter